MHRRPRGDDGAAAVEFAIVSVLLLTILFGILQYGYYFFQSTAAEHAAREGARLASVGIDDCAAWASTVEARGGAADVVRVQADYQPAGTDLERGDPVAVTVTWDVADFNLPFVPFIASGTVEETAITRVERLGSGPADCDVTL